MKFFIDYLIGIGVIALFKWLLAETLAEHFPNLSNEIFFWCGVFCCLVWQATIRYKTSKDEKATH